MRSNKEKVWKVQLSKLLNLKPSKLKKFFDILEEVIFRKDIFLRNKRCICLRIVRRKDRVKIIK